MLGLHNAPRQCWIEMLSVNCSVPPFVREAITWFHAVRRSTPNDVGHSLLDENERQYPRIPFMWNFDSLKNPLGWQ